MSNVIDISKWLTDSEKTIEQHNKEMLDKAREFSKYFADFAELNPLWAERNYDDLHDIFRFMADAVFLGNLRGKRSRKK